MRTFALQVQETRSVETTRIKADSVSFEGQYVAFRKIEGDGWFLVRAVRADLVLSVEEVT